MKIKADKITAIGDTHGDLEKTKKMLGHITKNNFCDDRTIIFLGDYVDIGPESKKTIDLLIGFSKYHRNTYFLSGNHDLNLIKALNLTKTPDNEFYYNRLLQRCLPTLKSYGVHNPKDFYDAFPDSHKEFFLNQEWVIEHEKYLFVHSGFNPQINLQAQIDFLEKKDYTFYKPAPLYLNELSCCPNKQTLRHIIGGHLCVQKPFIAENKICIDTGCGYGGPLTALHLPEMKLIQSY
jgi:serine/threonine protein phosphatase 1